MVNYNMFFFIEELQGGGAGRYIVLSLHFTLIFPLICVQNYAMFSTRQTLFAKIRSKSLSNQKNSVSLHRFSQEALFFGV